MNHTTILSIIKSFGFPITIRKMTAEAFVEMKAKEGNQKAAECLAVLGFYPETPAPQRGLVI
jgi:hypothetical protein